MREKSVTFGTQRLFFGKLRACFFGATLVVTRPI